jgi:hypothetical protein
MSTLSKPTLNKSAAAMAFAENKMSSAENVEKRIFHAPEGYRRLTINLREDLHKKLRFLAVEQDCTATDIIERLLIKELGK